MWIWMPSTHHSMQDYRKILFLFFYDFQQASDVLCLILTVDVVLQHDDD